MKPVNLEQSVRHWICRFV